MPPSPALARYRGGGICRDSTIGDYFARGRADRLDLRHKRIVKTPYPMERFAATFQGESSIHKREPTVLCWGLPAMVVPTRQLMPACPSVRRSLLKLTLMHRSFPIRVMVDLTL